MNINKTKQKYENKDANKNKWKQTNKLNKENIFFWPDKDWLWSYVFSQRKIRNHVVLIWKFVWWCLIF